MMEDIVQLRLHEYRQELFDYSFIPHSITSIERPPKQDVIAQHILRFPTQSHSNNSQQ